MKNTARIGVLITSIQIIIVMAALAQEPTIRSDIRDLGKNYSDWNSYTFPGFYYDIDSDFGTEKLTFRLDVQDEASAIISDQIYDDGYRGAVYTTKAIPISFRFDSWGQYEKIGFLGRDYFAAYNRTPSGQSDPFLCIKSKDRNLMTNGLFSEILMDYNDEKTFDSSSPLKLEQGYTLAMKSVDTDGKKIHLELTKDGLVVDSRVISPSLENAAMSDETYYYRKDLGNTKDIVIIAVHFKNVFGNAGNSIATIDGEFQINDTPESINLDQQYGKMSVRVVDPTTMTIEMDNKDHPITLSKNKDIELTDNIYIHTADQDNISADNPLRYFLYYRETYEDPSDESMENDIISKDVSADYVKDDIIKGKGMSYDNCNITGSLDLSNQEIRGDLYFYNTRFLNPVNFSSTIFKGDAFFHECKFYKDADFKYSQFYGNASFDRSRFEENADFRHSWFNKSTYFGDRGNFESGSTFNGPADFSNSTFNGYADFSYSTFNKETFFGFLDNTNRNYGTKFYTDAEFSGTKFNGPASFIQSEFDGNADFTWSQFNGDAYFIGSRFNRTYFDGSKFKGDALFDNAIFNEDLSLNKTRFDKLYIKWDNISSVLTYDDSAYMSLAKNFKDLGQFDDADNCYYQFRQKQLLHRSWDPNQKATKTFVGEAWWNRSIWCAWQLKQKIALMQPSFAGFCDGLALMTYGYGKKPLYPVIWSICTVIFFGIIWGIAGQRKRGDEYSFAQYNPFILSITIFLSGTKLFIDPPEIPEMRGWSESKVKIAFNAERVLGAFFSILLFLALGATIVR